MSQRKAAWVIKWIQEKIDARLILVRELREGLGRLSFVAGPLCVVRPFLGPIYAWYSSMPTGLPQDACDASAHARLDPGHAPCVPLPGVPLPGRGAGGAVQ
eukprot:7231007-Heterocapsa_arctica.AAC.1